MRVESLHQALAPLARGSSLELYHRAARAIRLSDHGDGRTPTVRRGHDEGSALRLAGAGGTQGFAAVSGSRMSSLRWAVERCRALQAPPCPDQPWAREPAGGMKLDRDGPPALPPLVELTAWLDRAREALASDGIGRPKLLELSIEVSATVESWVADGGLRASRTRRRVSALLRMREPWVKDRASKPVLVARRRWEELPARALRSALDDRRLAERQERPPPPAPVPVLFNPECSAGLVLALVRALHGPGAAPELPVGSAWRVADDPGLPGALFGGSFDDAGFATRRCPLADGRRIAGAIGGRGHLRRPSFRDRPEARPSQIVVAGEAGTVPEHGVLATAMELHPIRPDRWLLRLDGAHLEGGQPGAALRPSFLSISPEELVQRCVATVGPSRPSYLGVDTPALVFDRLSLE